MSGFFISVSVVVSCSLFAHSPKADHAVRPGLAKWNGLNCSGLKPRSAD